MTNGFSNLNIVSNCDMPYDYEYMGVDGVTKTGFHIQVLGQFSKKVQNAVIALENKDRIREFEARKRGKQESPKTAESDLQDTYEAVACRICGWNGTVNGAEVPEYSEENAIELVKVNPIIRAKVLEISNDITNFTKSR